MNQGVQINSLLSFFLALSLGLLSGCNTQHKRAEELSNRLQGEWGVATATASNPNGVTQMEDGLVRVLSTPVRPYFSFREDGTYLLKKGQGKQARQHQQGTWYVAPETMLLQLHANNGSTTQARVYPAGGEIILAIGTGKDDTLRLFLRKPQAISGRYRPLQTPTGNFSPADAEGIAEDFTQLLGEMSNAMGQVMDTLGTALQELDQDSSFRRHSRQLEQEAGKFQRELGRLFTTLGRDLQSGKLSEEEAQVQIRQSLQEMSRKLAQMEARISSLEQENDSLRRVLRQKK